MSQSLPVAAEIDWKLVASAAAVFIGTVVTTICGFFQGRKKSRDNSPAPETVQIAGAVLQDNQALRENTMAVRELRDQVFLLGHILERRIGVENDLHSKVSNLIKLLDNTG